jgi:NodT family efflux transporter outer membrane factor (OMF) lipoprotein
MKPTRSTHRTTTTLRIAAFAAIAIAGCEVGPDYSPPTTTMPVAFDIGPQLLPTTFPVSQPRPTSTMPSTRDATARAKTHPSPAEPVNLQHWWTALNDPQLDALVQDAVAANYDIGIAVARVQESRALYSAATGAEFPTLDATAGAGRGSGSNNTKGRIGQPLDAGTNTSGVRGLRELNYVAGFDATWEVDLFGRLRRQAEASAADADAAVEERNQVLVSVISDLCRNYIVVRADQARLAITQDNIAALRRTVDLTRVAMRTGIGNQLDVVLAERQVSAALAQVAPIDAEIKRAERQIAVLTARDPGALCAQLDAPAAIPSLAATVDPGLPLDLVRRRPDIHRAERELAAATARIGVATADLFPTLSLTGGIGVQGQGLGISPNRNALDWSVGPALRIPLLDFGRLDALVKAQDFRTQQRLLQYRKTVTDAVAEVEDAMTNYAAQQNRLDQLAVAVASSQRAVSLATERYRRGLADFLNVLDAQRQLYSLQDQLATGQLSTGTSLIALFKSLGGGWQGFQKLPPPPHVVPAIAAALGASR